MRPSWAAYESAPRRRARALRGVARATLTPANYPTAPVVAAYWWDGHPNFGDVLTPWLLRRYGRIGVHTAPGHAGMAGVGSILEQLPPAFAGTVWGSGLLYGEPVDLPHARFAAVRGTLTRDVLGLDTGTALGDPGLLVARHMRRPRPRWALGIVPHGMHDEHALVREIADRFPDEVTVIRTGGSVDSVVRRIGCAVRC